MEDKIRGNIMNQVFGMLTLRYLGNIQIERLRRQLELNGKIWQGLEEE